ncbi:MAG: cupredoxin domain-containing protein [Methylococcus sp.]|nr:cupredoxin domain-containing protein [Methylococcus sp.]
MKTKSITTRLSYLCSAGLFAFSVGAAAAENVEIREHNRLMDHGDGHLMDMDGGMIMGQNKDKLPGGCSRISEEAEITVRAGHKYAKDFPGTMYGFSEHEWHFKPCTRLTVHFINEDNVRHQWMMHGLPKYMYDKGMFHLEITGPSKISGTLILPKEDRTYLVHCDIAQHMEKGMKGELIVGKGSGTFPTIPGVTDAAIPDNYAPGPDGKAQPSVAPPTVDAEKPGDSTKKQTGQVAAAPASSGSWFSGSLVLGIVLGVFGTPIALRLRRERFSDMTGSDVLAMVGGFLGHVIDITLGLISRLMHSRGKKR